MSRSFPDSGVLIDAARGASARAEAALQYLGDPTRSFLTSPYVWLETVPKAEYMQRTTELSFYLNYFDSPQTEWCRDWERMEALARGQARAHGLGAMDALHVAAAHLLGADELVSAERPAKALYRSQLVRVVYLYAALR